jgi:hypothetical protein
MRIHPITGQALEDGFGALSDELQAERIHIPFIRQWQGDAAADAMLAKLKAAAAPAEEPPEIDDPEGPVTEEPANADARK